MIRILQIIIVVACSLTAINSFAQEYQNCGAFCEYADGSTLQYTEEVVTTGTFTGNQNNASLADYNLVFGGGTQMPVPDLNPYGGSGGANTAAGCSGGN